MYVPAHIEKYLSKSLSTNADAIVLDLEDAVPFSQKDIARSCVALASKRLKHVAKRVALRVNNASPYLDTDLGIALRAQVDLVILPKVENAEFVRQVANKLRENGGSDIQLIALIESPAGLLNSTSIASADPMLTGLNLGTEDFCLEMGMDPDPETLLGPSQQIVVAARAAGRIPLGYIGSIAQFHDISAFAEMLQRSARLGFEGGFAIHPSQIGPLNNAFSPSPDKIEHAKKVVDAFEESEKEGVGAISVDGSMVDLPVVLRAQRLLARMHWSR